MSVSCFGTVAEINNFNLNLLEKVDECIEDIENEDSSKWNYLWIYPANFAACAVGLIFAPVAILLNLIAAAVFKLISCCNSDLDGTGGGFLFAAALQTDMIPHLFIKAFYPTWEPDCAPLSKCTSQCLRRA